MNTSRCPACGGFFDPRNLEQLDHHESGDCKVARGFVPVATLAKSVADQPADSAPPLVTAPCRLCGNPTKPYFDFCDGCIQAERNKVEGEIILEGRDAVRFLKILGKSDVSQIPKPNAKADDSCPHGYRPATRLMCPECHPRTEAHEHNLNLLDGFRG